MEPSTSAGVGAVFAKYVGVQVVVSLSAVLLGFLVLRPKSAHEALVRIICTIIASFMFGPLLVSAVHSVWPALFASAMEVSRLDGTNSGILYVTAPLQIIAGLPAWWVIGAYIRWFDRRKDKDFFEIVNDFRASLPTPNFRKNKNNQEDNGSN